jgi:hypothetical protein
MKLYVDGRLRVSAADNLTASFNTDYPLLLGTMQYRLSYAVGLISEVRIYDRALSETEIDRHFRGLAPSKSGLVLWHIYDQQTGTTATDLSGQGNDGTIYGAEWTRREPLR